MISKHCGERLTHLRKLKDTHIWRCRKCKRYFKQRVRLAKEKKEHGTD